MPRGELSASQISQIRAYILAKSPDASVAREYSFEGVKHVLAEATSPVTSMAFAPLRNDLLTFGCADGEIWLVCLPPTSAPTSAQPSCAKVPSPQLQFGDGGYICRQSGDLQLQHRPAHMPPGLAGMLHSKYQITPAGSGLQITALDSSNHHVFVGDSAGSLHWYACELRGRQLSRLKPVGRLRLAAGAGAGAGAVAASGGGGGSGAAGHVAAVTALQYVPFCRTTDTPVLMAALQDGSLCIVRANEVRHLADLYLRRIVSPPAAAETAAAAVTASGTSFRTARSSSSSIATAAAADVPLITYGSDDTAVYIVDVTSRGFGGPAGPGRSRGGCSTSTSERPMTVTVLKAHRAAVTAVAWTYDEALLASADAEGLVVLWRRCRLF
ncbi:hypothetical protein VOLCADRAFT_86340 [Volvox carteri f. nagariensis]|uniref:Uncharacterized protein n=1 Tax=Volvox carteri f. nagariensis TaxID=3068 RepID=D8TII5_VOLCA|nr:uncharacterized protein VOLCADRAFT_86340 [Volvox carteri f. nagariensis]EFJ52897.1 hypothetical protein VOLCADRAFT_86340 [Volvox carteri f. nagariensis]|eukprot:XP_002945902.1 hypothetical protein VOLCADRAFT_86340 [Volvox carteri f. nagariensis]